MAWATPSTSELSGTEFDLEVAPLPVNFTGTDSTATAVNGLVPGPILRVREGDTVAIRVTNRLHEMTTIHWHGIILDAGMDGVPGISFPGIEPGETFVHRFKLVQSGTYWYHAHTLHEQTGSYGALIVEPADASNEPRVDRDYPVMLSDWTDENPVNVYLNLKKMGGYYNYQRLTAGDFLDDMKLLGMGTAISKRRIWNRTRMSQTDFSDVSAATYTYLMNGTSPAGNWTGQFVFSLLSLSLLGTALVYWLWCKVLQKVELNRANAFSFLIPVFGLAMGVGFYQERLGWIEIGGVTLALVGIILVNRPRAIKMQLARPYPRE